MEARFFSYYFYDRLIIHRAGRETATVPTDQLLQKRPSFRLLLMRWSLFVISFFSSGELFWLMVGRVSFYEIISNNFLLCSNMFLAEQVKAENILKAERERQAYYQSHCARSISLYRVCAAESSSISIGCRRRVGISFFFFFALVYHLLAALSLSLTLSNTHMYIIYIYISKTLDYYVWLTLHSPVQQLE